MKQSFKVVFAICARGFEAVLENPSVMWLFLPATLLSLLATSQAEPAVWTEAFVLRFVGALATTAAIRFILSRLRGQPTSLARAAGFAFSKFFTLLAFALVLVLVEQPTTHFAGKLVLSFAWASLSTLIAATIVQERLSSIRIALSRAIAICRGHSKETFAMLTTTTVLYLAGFALILLLILLLALFDARGDSSWLRLMGRLLTLPLQAFTAAAWAVFYSYVIEGVLPPTTPEVDGSAYVFRVRDDAKS
jgi:hypothetical protein